jgi:hypothetical protein
MSESYVSSSSVGITFAGSDAVRLYQATMIRSAIGLLQKGIQPTRGYTMTKALAIAGSITGKTYKRTKADQAQADLRGWCDEMSVGLSKIK